VAPAGHGKTELIARTAALGQRTLVLTHTHAGVHALRARLKKVGVAHRACVVDTIASWGARYAGAFPTKGQPPKGIPEGSAEWSQVYRGGKDVLSISGVRRVVESSYDRILIDEYQDCDALQHELAIALANILPTIVFGDPMQGIFEFTRSSVRWQTQVFPSFPLIATLEEPMRWRGHNVELGAWIAKIRGQLERGEQIDLAAAPVTFMPRKDAYEMGALFDRFDEREGSVAAIHCRRGACDQLAKSSKGAYQSIEEIGARRLQQFAGEWDDANSTAAKVDALKSLIKDTTTSKKLEDGASDTSDDLATAKRVRAAQDALAVSGNPAAAVTYIEEVRRHSRIRPFRGELLRDTARTLKEVDAGRFESVRDAATAVRQRVSASGRGIQKRTVSTPLLLKGLEFDHVVIPDAAHFANETFAAAKLFYVAISRSRTSLTISSSSRYLTFPGPIT
jgi:hypothetical protein